MIQFILTNQIFIIFSHAYGKVSTHLTRKQTELKADTKENPTNVPPVEYQDYLNTNETYSRITQNNI